MSDLSKKIANNILEYLIDPTRVPVKERVYFRPEEILQNDMYEKAKMDACKAYKDQKSNSDFYPEKNRSLTREAYIMDRKSLIASLDVLSKNFKNASDPFAEDLQTMALALSRMDDQALQSRLASDAPDLENVLVAAKTFKCPECGTKVLEQTKYCVKCKKKVKQADEKEAAGIMSPGQAGPVSIGERHPGSSATFDGKPIRTMAEFADLILSEKNDPKFKEWLKKLFGLKPIEGAAAREASEVTDFWTKEASDAVARSLVADVVGIVADEAPAEKPEEPAEKPDDEEAEKPAPVTTPTTEPVGPVQAKAEKEEKPEELEEEEVAKEAKAEKKEVKPEEKEEITEASVVDTDVLASYNFAGIEVPVNSMDEVGEMSAQEKANLARLF